MNLPIPLILILIFSLFIKEYEGLVMVSPLIKTLSLLIISFTSSLDRLKVLEIIRSSLKDITFIFKSI